MSREAPPPNEKRKKNRKKKITSAERLAHSLTLGDEKSYVHRTRSRRFGRLRRAAVRSHCGDTSTSKPLATEEDIPECEPLVTKPQATKDGIPVLLSSSYYVVSGSVGLEARALKPFCMALGTGADYNLIHKRILSRGYEKYLTQDGDIPALCDANGKRLATHGAVMLKARRGNAMFTTRFMVAERLTVDVLIGTEFLNRNIESIRPRSQIVEWRGSDAYPLHTTWTRFL